MLFRRNSHALVLAAALVPVLAGLVASPADAAAKCRKNCDRTAPTIAVGSPTSGSSVGGTVTVSGTSSDAVSVQSVAVSVDGGPWSAAIGTSSWSWSWATASVSDGSHTLTARAVDPSGNAATTSVSVNVVNTVPDTTAPSATFASPSAGSTVSRTVSVTGSAGDDTSLAKVEVRVDSGSWHSATGTSSWGWSWDTTAVADGSHTLTARATDTAGNSSTVSRSVTVSNASSDTTTTSGTTSGTTGIWTSPEGVKIDIRTTTGGWTHDEIYRLLTSSARDLAKIGPTLKVVVQDTNPTLSTVAASSSNGTYTSVSATIQLDARTTSTFSNRPDDILAHEYGHVWFNYYAYLKWQGDWSAYLAKRWTVADGSTTLATDSRTGSSYIWTPDEIAADDFRLLFGSSLAVSERNVSLNQQIPDPRSQPGLKDWILATWAG